MAPPILVDPVGHRKAHHIEGRLSARHSAIHT
jgi:hypothetical protein